jgi:hypothetical protein
MRRDILFLISRYLGRKVKKVSLKEKFNLSLERQDLYPRQLLNYHTKKIEHSDSFRVGSGSAKGHGARSGSAKGHGPRSCP